VAPPTPADLHARATDLLRRRSERYTPGRRRLVESLSAAVRPVSIPELLRATPGLAQSSAYRNLAVLERAGIVRRIVTADEFSRYELAEDLTEHHHHLICTVCGTVEDFTVSRQLERSLEGALARATAGTGFTADHHRLDLLGTCAACA